MDEVEKQEEAKPAVSKIKQEVNLEHLINSVRTSPIGMAHKIINEYKEVKNSDPAVVARLESILNAR